MGLLKRILRLYPEDKALKFTRELHNSFFAVSKSVGKFPFGIFSCNQKNYYLLFRNNISENSIKTSKSTKDFWQGLVSGKNSWIFFTNELCQPFFQLFDFHDKDSIHSLAIKTILLDKSPLYIFVANISENQLTDDLNSLIENFIKSHCDLFDWIVHKKIFFPIQCQNDIHKLFYSYFTKTLTTAKKI